MGFRKLMPGKRTTHPGSPVGEPLQASQPAHYDPTELCAKAFRLALMACVGVVLLSIPHGWELAKIILTAPIEVSSAKAAP